MTRALVAAYSGGFDCSHTSVFFAFSADAWTSVRRARLLRASPDDRVARAAFVRTFP